MINILRIGVIITSLFNSHLAFTKAIVGEDELEEMFWLAGLEYEPKEEIYINTKDNYQRLFGFNPLFELATLPSGMVVDSEPVRFWHNDTLYMIEIWKGQYYAQAGAELGFYVFDRMIGQMPQFRSAYDREMLEISYKVFKNDKEIFKREGIHWWLTGYKPPIYATPSELSLKDIRITFKIPGMARSFAKELLRMGYDPINDSLFFNDERNIVGFDFTDPKSEQPHPPQAKPPVLLLNKFMADVSRYARDDLKLIEDYSPEELSNLLEVYPFFKILNFDIDDISGINF